MTSAFDRVEQEFGGIDVVVNTAGIMLLSPLATFDLDDLDRMHRTNIRGTFVVSQQGALGSLGRSHHQLLHFGGETAVPGLLGRRGQQGGRQCDDAATRARAARQGNHGQCRRPGPTATELFLEGKDQAAIDNLAKATALEHTHEAGDAMSAYRRAK